MAASVRKHVYFSWDTWTQLLNYLIQKHGREKGLSLTIDQAVREFLAREN